MKQLVTLILLLVTCALGAVTFTAEANVNQANFGDTITLTLSLTQEKKQSDTVAPILVENDFFSIVDMKTSSSTSSSITIVNGVKSRNSSFTTYFKYSILCKREGHWSLPSTRITIAGKEYKTEEVPIFTGRGLTPAKGVSVSYIKSKISLTVGIPFELTQRIVVPQKSSCVLTNTGFAGISEPLFRELKKNFTVEVLTERITTEPLIIDGIASEVTDLTFQLTPINSGRYAIDRMPLIYNKKERTTPLTFFTSRDTVFTPELVLDVLPQGGKIIADTEVPTFSIKVNKSLVIAFATMALLLVLFFAVGFIKAKRSN